MKTPTKPKVKKEVKEKCYQCKKVLPKVYQAVDYKKFCCIECVLRYSDLYQEIVNKINAVHFKRKYHTDDKIEVIPDPSNKEPQQAEKWKYQCIKQEVKKESFIRRLLNNLRV